MSRKVLVSALTCASILLVPSRVLGGDELIRAEIQKPQPTAYDPGDPDMAGYKIKFDLRLTNHSSQPVSIPKSEAAGSDDAKIVVLGVQAKQPDGKFAHIVRSSSYGTGPPKYPPCTPLQPGKTVQISGVESGILLLRKQVDNLGEEPTIRFDLMMSCKEPDGQIPTKLVTTEEFRIRLPALHE